jgi:hypothetical protein
MTKKNATPAKAKQIAPTTCSKLTPPCTCQLEDCDHVCCGAKRDRKRRAEIQTLSAARRLLPPDSPAYQAMSKAMYHNGSKEVDLEPTPAKNLQRDFHDAEASSVLSVLGSGMKETLRSQEREHDLNRLIATIPALDQTADVFLAMSFFYRTKCEAKVGDIELRLKAAIHRCSVMRFTNILRQAPHTVKGWDAACHEILDSIDKHYLTSAKSALRREMHQHITEDPSIYADRVMLRTDIYKHFAELKGKTVDDEEIARNWIEGLVPKPVKVAAAVAVAHRVSYTIKDALDVARVAHEAHSTTPEEPAPLKSMTPAAPEIDGSYVQECMSQMEAQLAAMAQQHAQSASSMAEKMASMQSQRPAYQQQTPAYQQQAPAYQQQTPSYQRQGSDSTFTKFGCRHPDCNGAMHRWKDCPRKTVCTGCWFPGHHREGCYELHPELDHRPVGLRPNRDRGREDRKKEYERGRSPARPKADPRDRDRDNNRERSPARPSRSRNRSPEKGVIRDKDGKRLNEKGSR